MRLAFVHIYSAAENIAGGDSEGKWRQIMGSITGGYRLRDIDSADLASGHFFVKKAVVEAPE
jgi:hypothetical protein